MPAVRLFVAVFSLLFLSISSITYAACVPITPINDLTCSGTIRVQSPLELESYLSDLGINKKKNHYRHLAIDFDLNAPTFFINTPCKVTLKQNRKIEVAEDLCINANTSIIFEEGSYLRAQDILIQTENNAVILDHANIVAKNLSLISTGSSDKSRVHIRHTSNVHVDNLSLSAYRRAT